MRGRVEQVETNSLTQKDDKGAHSAFRLRSNIIIAEETTVGHRLEEEHSLSYD